MAPGRKFSVSTSARRTMLRKIARSASSLRLRTMLSLPRLVLVERAEGARIVTVARRLDLDHARAEISQDRRSEWAVQHVCQVDYEQAREGSGHEFLLVMLGSPGHEASGGTGRGRPASSSATYTNTAAVTCSCSSLVRTRRQASTRIVSDVRPTAVTEA